MPNIPYERINETPPPSTEECDPIENCHRLNPRLIPQELRPSVTKLDVRNDGEIIDFCVRCNGMVYGRYVEMAQKVIEGYMSHVKSYALEIEVAHFQNGSKSRSRVFLLRWLTF